MGQSRTENVKKNIFYGYIGTLGTSAFQIVCRTVFIYTLGVSYLGVSGLFTNVLGVLNFTELGIGSAINYALYKPIANEEKEKIKSLLLLYKQAYRLIAIVVALIGILLIPFLNLLVNTDIPMPEIRIFYYIFLFNTVSSYFVTYKTSYVIALQKNYIITNVTTIGTMITSVLQILLLLLGGNYLGYLLLAAVIELVQKVVTVIYLNKKYPILVEKNVKPLDEVSKKEIWKNVRALIIHKIGDVSVHQTDNIIISIFVNTTAVGLLSNYTTLNNFISMFTNKFFGSFTASFGNVLVKEDIEKQRKIFDVYDLLGFWIHGFVLCSFITLSQPFITIWLGKDLVLDDLTMILYFISLYLMGMAVIPYSFKIAAGRFDEDKWVSLVQSVVNLVVSVLAIRMIGLPGIFIGTIVSRMIVVFVRPYIVFKYVLQESPIRYYIRLILRTMLAFGICSILWIIKQSILLEITIIRFIILCIITVIVPNLILWGIFGRTEAFKDICGRIKRREKSE